MQAVFLKGEQTSALLPATFSALPKEARALQPAWPGADPKQSSRRAAGAAREHHQSPAWLVTLALKCHTLKIFGGKGWRTFGFINGSKAVR